MNALQTMKWLVKREFWEHRGGILWAQLVFASLLTLFAFISIAIGYGVRHGGGFHVNGVLVNDISGVVSAQERLEIAGALSVFYLPSLAPLLAMMAFVVFFYSLSSLYDDRKDRSILFWKSMPVSDAQTVLSKLFSILVLTPLVPMLIAIVVGLVFTFASTTAISIAGLNLFGPVLSSPDLYTLPLSVIACLPVYVLWALPSVGWLMLVSAWAKRVPFLWAVGVPVLTGVLISWSEAIMEIGLNDGWYWENIVGRFFAGFAPGAWLPFFDRDFDFEPGAGNGLDLLLQSWSVLAYPGLWIGVVLGAAFIFLAVRLRRWREDAA